MGKFVETTHIANTFQASSPAFGLLCPAGAEKRPASQLHSTQGKPEHDSRQHKSRQQKHNVIKWFSGTNLKIG